MSKTYLMILGVAALPLGGCGDSVDTGAVDTFIRTLAAQSCDWEFRCCKDAEIQSLDGTKFQTKEKCDEYRALALENELFIDRLAVKEGRLRLDGTRQTACLAQLASKMCNPDPNKPQMTPTNPMTMDACANVFVGNTPVGAECIYANECIEGAHCVSDMLAVGRGVCVPFQKVGEICNQTSDCDPKIPQIYCAQADFTCHVRGQLGEACAYTVDKATLSPTLPLLLECDTSQKSLYCDPISGSCKALPQANQACLSPLPPGVSSQCDPDPTLDLVCDRGTGTTSAGTCRAPGQLGADCTRFPCDTDLFCDRSGTTDTCQPLPTLNQQCSSSNGVCARPYYCNFTKTPAVCDQPAQLGQNCTQVTCDVNLYCDRTGASDLCKAQLPDGSICTSSEQCLSLDCVATGTGTTRTCQTRAVGTQCIGR